MRLDHLLSREKFFPEIHSTSVHSRFLGWWSGGGDVPAYGVAIGLLLECGLKTCGINMDETLKKLYYKKRHAVGVWGKQP